ncbi:MAG: hypothetical protein ACRDGM_04245 [bacterium]
MILLFGQSSPQHRQLVADHPDEYGSLLTPRSARGYLLKETGAIGVDNDCFAGFNERRFMDLLKWAGENVWRRVKFVTAPDVVADAARTLAQFDRWQRIIRDHDLPVAFALQDGIEEQAIPWGACDAIFVGGSTEFKLSQQADELIRESARRGKWIHVGRVSTRRRITHFRHLPVDSIDGTAFNRWPRNLECYQRWTRQGLLFAQQ